MTNPNLDLGAAPPKPKTRHRLKRIIKRVGLSLLVLVAIALAMKTYLDITSGSKLSRIVAELDRTDPGWRWDELDAKRADVPDAQNGAIRVEKAVTLLPTRWARGLLRSNSKGTDEPLEERLRELPPQSQLTQQEAKDLRAAIQEANPALAEARLLDDLRTGRYPSILPESLLVYSPSSQREIARLMWLNAMLLGQDRKIDEALQSGRCVLSAGTSLGDYPGSAALFVRLACRRVALSSIERTLAQGQASENALRVTQARLEEEVVQPLLLNAIRTERALNHECMGWLERGDLQRFAPGGAPGAAPSMQPLGGAIWKKSHAVLLEMMTEAVDIARLPPEKQREEFEKLTSRVKGIMVRSRPSLADWVIPPDRVWVNLTLPAVLKVAESFLRNQAELRCGIVALAVERYRLAHGNWPESLDQLVPKLLPAIPKDLFDGKPIRYRPLSDGVAIYSVGPDGIDDGGKVDPSNPIKPGTDLVFRLWDVAKRRQPAK